MVPEPYQVQVSDEALNDLKQRLSSAKFPDQLEYEDKDVWQFGTPVADIHRLVKYWKDDFDWRKAEATVNELPNFHTTVDVDGFGGLDIHFVHQPNTKKEAIPLLFSHGWPGSFIEVTKMLPSLKGEGEGPAFHLVAPSLPNFGFSEGISKKGFTLTKYAETCHKLMLQLGYNQYVTQGGDWGFSVTRAIGLQYPKHCKASHINLILGEAPNFAQQPILALQHAIHPYNAREKAGLERSAWFMNEGYGYNLLQSTKPQTVGYALADSPTALLAWIYEKLHDWTDGYQWTDDEILTWVSIYWFSKAGPAASVRIYYESTHPEPFSSVSTPTLRGWIPHVKLGVAHFPREISVVPNTWAQTLGPVVFQSEHEKGGHFAAWERPEAIAGDLRKMFGKGGPCFGVVAGKTGY